MAKVTVKLTQNGPRELRTSAAMQADLLRRGRAMADAAGLGHEVESSVGANRARVVVKTATNEARYNEAKYRKLSFAINAGRR